MHARALSGRAPRTPSAHHARQIRRGGVNPLSAAAAAVTAPPSRLPRRSAVVASATTPGDESSNTSNPNPELTGAAAAAPASSKTPWYNNTKNNEGWTSVSSAADLARAAHAARQSGRRVLALELWAPHCSVCKSSWPALSRLARDDALARDVLFAKASIEGDDVRRLLKEQQITGIPYVLVLDVGEPKEGSAPPPAAASEEEETVRGLLGQMFGQFVSRKLGGSAAGGGEAAAAAATEGAAAATAAGGATSVLAEASTTLILGQGASFKKIQVLRSNLAQVPALVKRGQRVVVDPNGLVVLV